MRVKVSYQLHIPEACWQQKRPWEAQGLIGLSSTRVLINQFLIKNASAIAKFWLAKRAHFKWILKDPLGISWCPSWPGSL